jgi:hypothetical protein
MASTTTSLLHAPASDAPVAASRDADPSSWDEATILGVAEWVTGRVFPHGARARVLAVGRVAQVRWTEAHTRAVAPRRANTDVDDVFRDRGVWYREEAAEQGVLYALEKLPWVDGPPPADVLRAVGAPDDPVSASQRAGVRWRAMTLVRVVVLHRPKCVGEELLLCLEPRWLAARRTDRVLYAMMAVAWGITGLLALPAVLGLSRRSGGGLLTLFFDETTATALAWGSAALTLFWLTVTSAWSAYGTSAFRCKCATCATRRVPEDLQRGAPRG